MCLLANRGIAHRTLNIAAPENDYTQESVTWDPSSPISRVLSAIPQLSELQISDCLYPRSTVGCLPTLSMAGECFPAVKSLGLHCNQSVEATNLIPSVFPNLEVLSILYLPRPTDICPWNLLHLKTLRYDQDPDDRSRWSGSDVERKYRSLPWKPIWGPAHTKVCAICCQFCITLPPTLSSFLSV